MTLRQPLLLLVGLSLGLHAPCAQAGSLAEALLKAPSATAVLQDRCDTLTQHTAHITAEAAPSGEAPPVLDVARLLALGTGQTTILRHVHLNCGARTLSDAWNWYVPARLTPAMNETLLHTHTPFGRAVAETHFTRERLRSEALDPAVSGCMTLQNIAVLHRAVDHAPISLVVERYDDRD